MRITLISLMNQNEINSLMSNIKMKTCKVPYGIDDDNRYNIDNLPYHFTIFSSNKENQEKVIKIAEKITINSVKVRVNEVKIMKGKYDSSILYLSIEDSKEIKELQRMFFKELKEEKYNPNNFVFHITLHIDKDYKKVLYLQKKLNENFKPFYLEFNKIALFDYPGKLVKEISFKC